MPFGMPQSVLGTVERVWGAIAISLIYHWLDMTIDLGLIISCFATDAPIAPGLAPPLFCDTFAAAASSGVSAGNYLH